MFRAKQLAQSRTSPTEHTAKELLGRVFDIVSENPTEGFYVAILDEITKWTDACFLPDKSSVFNVVFAIAKMLETQTG